MATHNALIAVTNGGSRPTDALLTIHYDNGRQKYEVQQSIAAGDQMWLNLAELIRNRVPDRKGRTLPADLTQGTYELEDLNPGLGGNLIEGKVSLDKTWGHLAYGCIQCCGYSPYLSPDTLGLGVGGDGGISAYGTNNCTGANGYGLNSYFARTGVWWSGNTATAKVTSFNGHGVAPGATNGFATATIPSGDGNPKVCPQTKQQGDNNVSVGPSGEITTFDGTILITQGQFLMTREPGASSYDNHSVTESSPVLGTNSCWWSTSGMVQYPKVQGSTWIVDQGGSAGHNQYGLDTIGFESGVINLIQTQGPAHGVEFPCVINIYQLMDYDGFDLYVTNLLTQTIGSNNVQVCRAGVCSGTIPF